MSEQIKSNYIVEKHNEKKNEVKSKNQNIDLLYVINWRIQSVLTFNSH